MNRKKNKIKKKIQRDSYSLCSSKIVIGRTSDSRFKMNKCQYLLKWIRTEYFIIEVTSCGSPE